MNHLLMIPAETALRRAEERRAATAAALRELRAPDVYFAARLSKIPEQWREYSARLAAAMRADESARQAVRRARRYYEDRAAALL